MDFPVHFIENYDLISYSLGLTVLFIKLLNIIDKYAGLSVAQVILK
jgi:hypothetical protein